MLFHLLMYSGKSTHPQGNRQYTQGETYYFKHDEPSDRSLITANEELSDLVGDYQLREVVNDLISRGWRRDQITFFHVGGTMERGPFSVK